MWDNIKIKFYFSKILKQLLKKLTRPNTDDLYSFFTAKFSRMGHL